MSSSIELEEKSLIDETIPQYHRIITDNDFMNDIGLGSFTTGMLYEWLSKQDNVDILKTNSSSDRYTARIDIMKNILNVSSPNSFKFYPWNPNDRSYSLKSPIDPQLLIFGRSNATYSEISSLDFKESTIIGDVVINANNTITPNIKRNETTVKNTQSSFLRTDFGLIHRIIELNNFKQQKTFKEMGKNPKNWPASDVITSNSGIPPFPPVTVTSRQSKTICNYINMINTSASGGIQWKVDLTFNLNLNKVTSAGLGTCRITQPVTFMLKLSDEALSSENRSVTFTNLDNKIIVTPRDHTGAHHKSDQGRSMITTPVAVNINGVVDPIDNSFRSGTLQAYGIIVGGYPLNDQGKPTRRPSTGNPDVDELNELIGAAISDGSKVDDIMVANNPLLYSIQPSFGEALLLTPQNGNPSIISAQMQKTDCDDQNDVVKKFLHVANYSPRTWKRGTHVILNNINGTDWMPMEIGESIEAATPTQVGGQWQFTYLMANGDNHYRAFKADGTPEISSDGGGLVFSPEGYEGSFKDYYYRSYPGSIQDKNLNIIAGVNVSTLLSSNIPHIQITSFDHMGENVGGVNGDKHSISQTVFSLKYDYSDQEPDKNGFESQFFGAVFPDGYVLDEVPDYYYNAGLSTIYQYSPIHDYGVVGTTNGAYFKESAPGLAGPKPGPFSPGLTRNFLGEGIFHPNGKALNLSMLPADIALNGRPNSSYGGPLIKIPDLAKSHSISDPLTLSTLYTRVKNYLASDSNRWSWIEWKSASNLEGPIYDLQPISPNKIQFRPLSIEHYAAHEGDSNSLDFTMRRGGNDGVASFARHSRHRANPKVVGPGVIPGNEPLYSANALYRSGFSPTINASNGLTPNANNTGHLIRYGSYWQRGGIFNNKSSYGLNYPTHPAQNRPKLYRIWDDSFQSEPASAVGIIGASCSVISSSDVLKFNVSVYIGVNNDKTLGDAITWGASEGKINKTNTSSIHVRMFHDWPRELTVYDPRFFSVFHYAPGIRNVLDFTNGKIDYKQVKGDWYFEGTKISQEMINGNPSWAITIGNNNHAFYSTYDKDSRFVVAPAPSRPYWVPEIEIFEADNIGSSSDYRYPTCQDDSIVSIADGLMVPNGSHVWSNGFGPPGASNIPKIRDPEDWFVEAKCRGKLLPFKFKKRTIGINPNLNLCDIVNKGSGYKVGDKFTTIGGNGKNVEIVVATIDGSGGITSIAISNIGGIPQYGEDFHPTDFASSTDPPTAQTSKVRLKNISVSGKNAEILILSGACYDLDSEVSKPIECIPTTLITPETKNGGIIESTINGLELQITKALSKNKRYRLFINALNDVSYVMYYSQDYGEIIPTRQQHMTITIT